MLSRVCATYRIALVSIANAPLPRPLVEDNVMFYDVDHDGLLGIMRW